MTTSSCNERFDVHRRCDIDVCGAHLAFGLAIELAVALALAVASDDVGARLVRVVGCCGRARDSAECADSRTRGRSVARLRRRRRRRRRRRTTTTRVDDDDGRRRWTTTTDDDDEDDGRLRHRRRGRQRRRRSTTTTLTTTGSRTMMRRRMMMMIFLLRGASTAKQSVARTLPRRAQLSETSAGTARGRCALARGVCAGTGKAGVHWLDYVVLPRARPM